MHLQSAAARTKSAGVSRSSAASGQSILTRFWLARDEGFRACSAAKLTQSREVSACEESGRSVRSLIVGDEDVDAGLLVFVVQRLERGSGDVGLIAECDDGGVFVGEPAGTGGDGGAHAFAEKRIDDDRDWKSERASRQRCSSAPSTVMTGPRLAARAVSAAWRRRVWPRKGRSCFG